MESGGSDYRSDHRRQASEAIKDLMVSERRSRLPLVLGVLAAMGLLAGAGYWFYMPPDKRLTPEDLLNRIMAISKGVLNAPIGNTPAPASADTKKPKPASSTDNVGLLSN